MVCTRDVWDTALKAANESILAKSVRHCWKQEWLSRRLSRQIFIRVRTRSNKFPRSKNLWMPRSIQRVNKTDWFFLTGSLMLRRQCQTSHDVRISKTESREEWGTPGNSCGRCAARFSKSWPYFSPKNSGGDSTYERGGDACRQFWIKPLKETDLGVAQAFFDP